MFLKTNKTKVKEALNELGSTKEQILKTLIDGGYRGYIGNGKVCPVANYLNAKLEDDVTVGTFFIHYPSLMGTVGSSPIPPHILSFIREFDRGKYPDLELKYSRR
jgi:hypothetical protein